MDGGQIVSPISRTFSRLTSYRRMSPTRPPHFRTFETPIFGQISIRGQERQRGVPPVQMYLPKGNSRRLIAGRYSIGSFGSSAVSVCSGVFAWT
jgi:hypothetical protein